ncbi:hypothetical protein A2673_03045 [Candidatus Kaiserbacteria bacterium RIFCSPHIGHO2_01_FULL_50_13]|uniref:Uncharacterized protein n=1 Tax=Candidatus Kaiserbacteria bacterium RIFCSPLOWO2_01_FULL_50_24 TaxID=1798507 RepID=A0A1F6ERE2_9BACT|nr:MAG: hypothetical protein A2673_03045 [Candidatus Kaiserbacteria bacterium RIFCSPHIGHO2_01_FULL_50_13]OGG76201.1 MAG: hypothetical protein A3A34_01780 [Candidatus Kaiserbacteria bacterium RIFCSPLOWO2_01_FULL_50_24]OGG81124.1 MAG: hypothetical protein A3H74_01560 [Candidatus Kaiserbacteria bacterium RIFCSPLOWO2_02_FULL_51_13]
MEQNSFENQNRAVTPKAQKSPVGPVVGTVIIIALLAFGALYFWGDRLNDEVGAMPYTLDAEHAATLEGEAWMPESSDSDVAADIAAELDAFDAGALEGAIGADLDAVGEGF